MAKLLNSKYFLPILGLSTLALSGCKIKAVEVSEISSQVLKNEAAAYDKLVATNSAVEESAQKSPERLQLLNENAKAFQEYFDVWFIAQKKVFSEFAVFNVGNIKAAMAEDKDLLNTLRPLWEQTHLPLLKTLLAKKVEQRVYLASWDYANLGKFLRNIDLFTRERNDISLKLPDGTTDLLEIFFFQDKDAVPNKLAIKFFVQENKDYFDTSKLCAAEIAKLSDSDCVNDITPACEPQLDLSCVEKLVRDNINMPCRKRVISGVRAAGSGESKYEVSLDGEKGLFKPGMAFRFTQQLKECHSATPVTRSP